MLALPPARRRAALRALPPEARAEVPYRWELWGRQDQIWRPDANLWTAALAGRGWGKTRYGVEAVKYVAAHPELCGGRAPRGPNDRTCGEGGIIGIGGRTSADVRETLLYGPSGLITNSPPSFRPEHHRGDSRLVWPNGVIARLFSGDEPRTFLGANLGFLLLDELSHWSGLAEAIPMFELTLRHGEHPRGIVTTTPTGDPEFLKFLFAFDDSETPITDEHGELVPLPNIRVIYGSTYDNAANLPPDMLTKTVRRYEGTELGDQELRGRILLGVRAAMWKHAWFRRLETIPESDPIVRTAIVIDPAVSEGAESAETGIVVASVGRSGLLYMVDDASGHYSETEWTDLAAALAFQHDADWIVAEDNNGGDLVEGALRRAQERMAARSSKSDPMASRLRTALRQAKIRRVHATVGKTERARLVVGRWEYGQVVHVGNPRTWVRLEHQLTTFNPEKPRKKQRADRMDAAVWSALTLLGDGTDRKPLTGASHAQAWARIAEEIRRRAAG